MYVKPICPFNAIKAQSPFCANRFTRKPFFNRSESLDLLGDLYTRVLVLTTTGTESSSMI